MNDVYIVVRSTSDQRQFMAVSQHKESFIKYYNSHAKPAKDDVDALYDECTCDQWAKVETVKDLVKPFMMLTT